MEFVYKFREADFLRKEFREDVRAYVYTLVFEINCPGPLTES